MVLVAGSVAAIGGKAGTRRYGPATHANWRGRIMQKMQRIKTNYCSLTMSRGIIYAISLPA